jgi:beta-lactamase class A
MSIARSSDVQRQVAAAVDAFVATEPGRSVALTTIRGPAMDAYWQADLERPAGSIVKVALTMAVYSAARAGRLVLDQPVEVGALPRTAYRTILMAFEPAHRLTVRELCRICLITSDNPVANFLLELVGPEAVTAAAHEAGCTRTSLRVSFTDQNLGPPGRLNTSTARDSLALLVHLASDGDYEDLADALANNLRSTRIPLRLPDETRVVHKTGTLQGVVNDAGVVYGEQTDLAIAFLCDGERDPALTSIEIGDCVAAIWQALGERVDACTAP